MDKTTKILMVIAGLMLVGSVAVYQNNSVEETLKITEKTAPVYSAVATEEGFIIQEVQPSEIKILSNKQ
jgi:hypothetical protein